MLNGDGIKGRSKAANGVARAAILSILAFTVSCATFPPSRSVQGFSAALDERQSGGGAWSIYWTLCWDAFPRALDYEVQVMTSEGVSPILRRQPERCLSIEVAAGDDIRAEGLASPSVQLAVQGSQLAYRVRARLFDEQRTPWSQAFAAGQPISSLDLTSRCSLTHNNATERDTKCGHA